MPELRILVLSSHCDDYTLFRVEKSGVHGFIDKTSNTVETLRSALKELAAGRVYFSASFQQAKVARRADPRSFTKVLSEWERAILSLVGQGLNDDEIGKRLKLSPRTVQTHRSNLLRKLGIKGTPKLIAFAIEHGFTQVPPKSGSRPVYP
jgi:DNA-binding NarL/FixJ family response regulator